MNPSGLEVDFENVTLSIEDSGSEAMDKGRPNGFLDGEVKASGEIEVDLENYGIIQQAVRAFGSWSDFPVQDILFFASSDDLEEKVEAFGCKLYLSEVVNAKASGGEKLIKKIPYKVTGKDFVKLNDIPYLPEPDDE